MMLGGGLMMGLGLLFLLLIIAIPVMFVIVLAGGSIGFLQKRNTSPTVYQTPISSTSAPVTQSAQAGASPSRYCAHCGAGLQPDWSHCPQCGAPVQ